MKTRILIVIALGLYMSGCAVYELPMSPDYTHTESNNVPYVNAYVNIPDAVACIIANDVSGYEMPPLGRYSATLTEYGWSRDSWNLPSYVRADFNGDGYDDFAYMFSEYWYDDWDWYLTTKLLIVVSDGWGGYTLSQEIGLGTVTASSSVPVEEYWAIGLLKKGTHTIGTVYNNTTVEKSVTLDNDGIYLTSLDPQERSLFTVDNTTTYEMAWDMGTFAKRQALSSTARANRIIHLPK
jgi:hypothetical protein